eukprot:gene4347-6151_t
MNKANQKALIQATNIGLISIRQSEIQYYTNLYISFGTQAALIGGFTYNVFTQNVPAFPAFYPSLLATIILDVYWVLSALTISASVHVVINCMMLQVLGPGLALNGPIGSMAKATEGMKAELNQIVTAFGITIVLFAISTTLSYWVIMDFQSAIITTVLSIWAGYYWYYYCERIYLRFYYNPNSANWRESEAEESYDQFDSSNHQHLNEAIKSSNNATNESYERGRPSAVKSFFSSLRRKSTQNNKKNNIQSKTSDVNGPAIISTTSNSNNPKYIIVMEGYLAERSASSIDTINESQSTWTRRYFTLSKNGDIYYYKSRQDYRMDPKYHINDRPVKLSEYYITVENGLIKHDISDVKSESASSMWGGNMIGNTTPSHPIITFQMIFRNRDEEMTRVWILRCDTEEELDGWVQVMSETSPSSFHLNKQELKNDSRSISVQSSNNGAIKE